MSAQRRPKRKLVAVVFRPDEAADIKRAARLGGLPVYPWCRRVLLAVAREQLAAHDDTAPNGGGLASPQAEYRSSKVPSSGRQGGAR